MELLRNVYSYVSGEAAYRKSKKNDNLTKISSHMDIERGKSIEINEDENDLDKSKISSKINPIEYKNILLDPTVNLTLSWLENIKNQYTEDYKKKLVSIIGEICADTFRNRQIITLSALEEYMEKECQLFIPFKGEYHPLFSVTEGVLQYSSTKVPFGIDDEFGKLELSLAVPEDVDEYYLVDFHLNFVKTEMSLAVEFALVDNQTTDPEWFTWSVFQRDGPVNDIDNIKVDAEIDSIPKKLTKELEDLYYDGATINTSLLGYVYPYGKNNTPFIKNNLWYLYCVDKDASFYDKIFSYTHPKISSSKSTPTLSRNNQTNENFSSFRNDEKRQGSCYVSKTLETCLLMIGATQACLENRDVDFAYTLKCSNL
jgi:hypothetical protein